MTKHNPLTYKTPEQIQSMRRQYNRLRLDMQAATEIVDHVTRVTEIADISKEIEALEAEAHQRRVAL